MTLNELPVPAVHLNGTGGSALCREYRTAIAALRDAQTACAAVTVHGRDYYTLDRTGEALDKALEHRLSVLRRLNQLQTEMSTILAGIHAQREA